MMAATKSIEGIDIEKSSTENCYFLEPLISGNNFHKVYIDESFRKNCTHWQEIWRFTQHYGIITECYWTINIEANEWLTENCKHNWGIFVEEISVIVIVNKERFNKGNFIECLPRAFIGFESLDDALLFKLSMV